MTGPREDAGGSGRDTAVTQRPAGRALPSQSGARSPVQRRTGESDEARLSRLAPDDPRRPGLRSRVVEAHLPLVKHLAGRYRHLGEPVEDLVQVGTIGLIHAVDRFDAERGVELASYATPVILGEIRQHFRDRTSAVRVPRRLSELHAAMVAARGELSQQLGRSPTVAELAAHLGQDEESVLDALEAGRARIAEPLPTGADVDAGTRLAGRLHGEDDALAVVDDRETLRPLLQQLPAREKQILAMRFLRGLSQAQIADELGISQMHVSRLLAQTVGRLTRSLADDRS